MAYLLDQKYLVEEDKKLKLGPAASDAAAREQLPNEIRLYLRSA